MKILFDKSLVTAGLIIGLTQAVFSILSLQFQLHINYPVPGLFNYMKENQAQDWEIVKESSMILRHSTNMFQ